MTTKREPVPRVPPMSSKTRSTAHLVGEFPFTEVPNSGPRSDKHENNHNKEKKNMANSVNKLKRLIVDNKDVIRRRTLVVVGAATGLIVTSAIVERLNRPRVTNVVIYNEAENVDNDPSSEPLEP